MNKSACQIVPKIVALIAAVILLSPAPAWACTRTPPPPILVGQPAHEATDVPTNVVLRYAVPDGVLRFDDPPQLVPGEYMLQAQSGMQVELRVTRPAEHELEMVPAQALQPNTTYTLSARWKLPQGIEADAVVIFETGNGPLDDTAEPPHAVMRSYQLERDHTASCGPRSMDTCIAVEDDEVLIEYTFRYESGAVRRSQLRRGSAFASELAGFDGRNCVELRRFSANGSRGEPLRLCPEDASLSDLTSLTIDPVVSCSAGGIGWWDATGKSGCEPGPDGGDYCAETSQISAQTAEVTDTTPSEDAGVVPTKESAAAPSCSTSLTQPSAPGWFMPWAMLASLGILHTRRRYHGHRARSTHSRPFV